MGQRRQKHYISISTCLPTSTHFSFRFFRLVYFQLQRQGNFFPRRATQRICSSNCSQTVAIG